jgi:hypothetical protein
MFTDTFKYIDAGLQAISVLCELEAMKAANDLRRIKDLAQAYDETAFVGLANRIEHLREDIQ